MLLVLTKISLSQATGQAEILNTDSQDHQHHTNQLMKKKTYDYWTWRQITAMYFSVLMNLFSVYWYDSVTPNTVFAVISSPGAYKIIQTDPIQIPRD